MILRSFHFRPLACLRLNSQQQHLKFNGSWRSISSTSVLSRMAAESSAHPTAEEAVPIVDSAYKPRYIDVSHHSCVTFGDCLQSFWETHPLSLSALTQPVTMVIYSGDEARYTITICYLLHLRPFANHFSCLLWLDWHQPRRSNLPGNTPWYAAPPRRPKRRHFTGERGRVSQVDRHRFRLQELPGRPRYR